MTPLPVVEDHRLSVPDTQPSSPPRRLLCMAPFCRRPSRQRHHIVARSKIKRVLDWILIDGQPVMNVADLCNQHHDDLESKPGGVYARLRWLGPSGWGWYVRDDGSEGKDRILWQDPKTGTLWKFIGFVRGGTK
jgi:hypothetical protein